MKRLLVVLTVAAPTTALANPQPDLELGANAGTDAAMQHQAVAVGGEIPFPFSPMWRAHGQLSYGTADAQGSMGGNVYMQVRLGVEARPCMSREVCVIAGVDGAFMTESYIIGRQDSGVDGLGTFDLIEERGGFALIPRLALDIGSDHLRFRPGVEATLSKTLRDGNWGNSDLDGVAATAAIAYRW